MTPEDDATPISNLRKRRKKVLKKAQKDDVEKVPVVINDRTTIMVLPDEVKGAKKRYLKKMADSQPTSSWKGMRKGSNKVIGRDKENLM